MKTGVPNAPTLQKAATPSCVAATPNLAATLIRFGLVIVQNYGSLLIYLKKLTMTLDFNYILAYIGRAVVL